ncbi:UNVERIFIED_CONTAM: hypothetical protein GTU68_059128 [Idotea baltica]|nr:hypothetical protein [Idotea baltica]
MEQVKFEDLGLINYQEAWDYQTGLHKSVVAHKLENYLLFCEHPPVYTLGKSGSLDHLLLNEAELEEGGFSFHKINRGGDITYHGPGQVVAYPIFDLDGFFTDVHKYVRFLEEVVIRTLAEYDIEGTREKGYTGVWLPAKGQLPKRKICAIGVHLSRWVTMHGFAFNVNTNLQHFQHIIPCGIQEDDKTVTSLATELGSPVDVEVIKTQLKAHFAELFVFGFE